MKYKASTIKSVGITVACDLALLLLAPSLMFAQASLDGHVRNGTTGSPAANVPVLLIQLQGGMETVADTKTDAQGRFHFVHAAIGKQPMLIRAMYRGVNFHQPLPPGRNTADVEVFEPSTDAKTISVPSRLIVFQPNGPKLIVGEEYVVQNNSNPPAAFFKEKGNFEFQIPNRAELQQVAAWGPSGMPVVQAAIDRGGNRHAIAFAFRPGESGVRLSYQMLYPGNAAVVPMFFPYAVERVLVVAPPTLKIDSPGFRPAGTEQGMSLYERDALVAGSLLDINISGTAPPPSAQSAQAGADSPLSSASATAENESFQSGPRDANQDRAFGGIRTLPGRLDTLKWPVSIGFGALFGLGAILLWKKSPPVRANGAPANVPRETFLGSGATGRDSRHGDSATPALSEPAIPTGSRVADRARQAGNLVPRGDDRAGAEIRDHVQKKLGALKDALFRLELRHQAGTISDEEYGRERARVESVLRELVRVD